MNEELDRLNHLIIHKQQQLYEETHKEERKKQKHNWRINNIEKIHVQDKKHFEDNREHYRQYRKDYYVRTGK